MERFLAILNPTAGSGRCAKLAAGALSRLRDAGLQVDVVETSEPADATRIARGAYQEGRRYFIAVGGDGTSFEIINGLFPEAIKGERVSLGFLPLGTGNSFLRDFTDKGTEHAIDALVQGRSRTCDVVRFTHNKGALYYINILAIGFAANVAATTNSYFKVLGPAGYGLGVFWEVARLSSRVFPFHVDRLERWERPTAFISFCNSRFTGGSMMMAPFANTADGKLDVISAGHFGRIALLRTFPRIFSGAHVSHHAFKTASARTIEFDISDNIVLMIDGEVFQYIPKRLDVMAGALDVMA